MVYRVLGGFLALRWRWVWWPHLVAVAWAVVIVVYGTECPLTYLENELRARAGEAELVGGFVDTYVEGVIYPQRYVDQVRAGAALVVLLSWAALARRPRATASHRSSEAHQSP